MAKIVKVLTDKKINLIFATLISQILKYKESLEDWETLLKRCILLSSKYYVPREPGKPIKILTDLVSGLVPFYNFKSSVEEFKMVTSEFTKLLIKILSCDKNCKSEIYELLIENAKENRFFEHLCAVIKAGSGDHVR